MNGYYDLTPQYDKANSFYRKAQVSVLVDGYRLYSYNTPVAEIRKGVATVFGTYSHTTLRHIKEFLKQHGFTATTKQQIEKDYM